MDWNQHLEARKAGSAIKQLLLCPKNMMLYPLEWRDPCLHFRTSLRREASIQSRIEDAARSGAITEDNRRDFMQEFDRIKDVENAFRSSDNGLSDWEVMTVARDLDRLDAEISRTASKPPKIDTSGAAADHAVTGQNNTLLFYPNAAPSVVSGRFIQAERLHHKSSVCCDCQSRLEFTAGWKTC